MEEGDIARSFFKSLGLVLAPKVYLDQSQAFKEVNSQAGRKKRPIFFPDDPLPGAPRHVCTQFRVNIRRSDYAGPILSRN